MTKLLCITSTDNVYRYVISGLGNLYRGRWRRFSIRWCPSHQIFLSWTRDSHTIAPGSDVKLTSPRWTDVTSVETCTSSYWSRTTFLLGRLLSCGLWCGVVLYVVINISFHFSLKEWRDMLLQKVGNHLQDYAASQPRRPQSVFSQPPEPQTSSCVILYTFLALSIYCWSKYISSIVIHFPSRWQLLSIVEP
jgi:hypothetical protein